MILYIGNNKPHTKEKIIKNEFKMRSFFMKKKEEKKYFLKDSVLNNIDDDRFNQAHIVNNLRMIIENTNPPYNIGIIGKWGIGKSSILKILLKKYKEDDENYIVQEINAWKYEKE